MGSQDEDDNETVVYTKMVCPSQLLISFMVNFICVMLLSYRLLIKIHFLELSLLKYSVFILLFWLQSCAPIPAAEMSLQGVYQGVNVRGVTSVWSWSLPLAFCSWMNLPQAWIHLQLILSCSTSESKRSAEKNANAKMPSALIAHNPNTNWARQPQNHNPQTQKPVVFQSLSFVSGIFSWYQSKIAFRKKINVTVMTSLWIWAIYCLYLDIFFYLKFRL